MLKINLRHYLDACLSFADESKEWSRLPTGQHYTINLEFGDTWRETCDNNIGGIDVAWSFHKSNEQIKRDVLDRFTLEIVNMMECLGEHDDDDTRTLQITVDLI